MATMSVFALFAARRQLSGIAAASDADQAGLLRDAIARLLQLNEWLGQFLDVQKARIVNTHTGSELKIITSDVASSYGLTPNFVLADELSHWSNSDLWDSLLSACAKRADSMLVVITNAGWRPSWQFDLREKIRNAPDWHFHSLPGPCASWITPASLAEQERLLPEPAYRRLWLNEWTDGAGDAIQAADLNAAVTLREPTSTRLPHHSYVAGLDLGLSRDASALVILAKHVGGVEHVPLEQHHTTDPIQAALIDNGLLDPIDSPEHETIYINPTGRLRVCEVHVWHPIRGSKVDLEQVEATIIDTHRRFGFTSLSADPWQAEMMIQRLTRSGVPVEATPFVAANLTGMASAVLEAFNEHLLDLFPHQRLLADLRALRVEERSYGVRLVSPRGPSGHGDSATALSLALLAARRHATHSVGHVTGELVCYP